MRIRISLIAVLCLCAGLNVRAQALDDQMGSVPAAVCKVAPLPPAMAEAKAKLEAEKKQKLIRQGSYLPNVDAKVLANVEKYIGPGQSECAILKQGNAYTIATPIIKITNTSHGRENVEYNDESFNVKKDRMSYAILRNGNEITIVNHKNKTCKMSDFEFSTNSEAIKMVGNKIEFIVPTLNIAAGNYPSKHKVTCIHKPSNSKYIFDISLGYRNSMYCSGEDLAYSFELLGSDSIPDLALMCNLKTNQLEVVHLPFNFSGAGRDGSNGGRGKNGKNGKDEVKYTDSDGKEHYKKGTCAEAGQDGGNGGDGTDGATYLFCVSQILLDQYGLEAISGTIEAGKGGQGGEGGKGGIHGQGSGCSGKAPDGKRGKNGKDGKRGDFLYVVADVNGFYLSMFGK